MEKHNVYEDQVVVITGSGRGIGRSLAQSYAAKGAQVVVAEISPSLGTETERLIREKDQTALFAPTDVSDPEQIVALMETVAHRFKTIDILINNAGLSRFGSPYDLAVADWDTVLNTNLRSVFLCSREAAKLMRLNNGGSLVNIASTRAFMSEANSEAYAASKGGIIALTHAMAASFSKDKIQVNSISPGWIETGNQNDLSPEDHAQHWSGRVGQVEDIARACLFLTHPDNRFISGTNLTVDGGMTKKMIYI